eukprot:CAMPEP_0197518582 /NCGR_PEP_ID=MMETSP1318-20131121/3804_1 /TAXON_ID=552666 /ORGANISM="Partenskyella glossopodia, Strain RCC365" /LENGTH=550 /DNA_ID=CAMNT_0043069047 /DNA_START=84 /DNA_END=1736 /DNA_ORIENTATION=+
MEDANPNAAGGSGDAPPDTVAPPVKAESSTQPDEIAGTNSGGGGDSEQKSHSAGAAAVVAAAAAAESQSQAAAQQKEDAKEKDLEKHEGKERPGPIESEEAQKYISWDGGIITPPKWEFADYYAIFLIFLLWPFLIFAFVFATVLSIPMLTLCKIYTCFNKGPRNYIERDCSFGTFVAACFILNLPKMILSVIHCIIWLVLSHILCAPVGIFVIGPTQVAKNFRALKPFCQIPPYSFDDIVVAVIGGFHRQGFCEFFSNYCTATIIDPFFKYFLICNPWTMKLAVRYCNQWTKPMGSNYDDMHIIHALRTNVSRVLHGPGDRDEIDTNVFSAFYQLPGPKRNKLHACLRPVRTCKVQTAMGFQFTKSICHFTHSGHAPRDGSVAPYSTTAKHLVYPVSLFYFNPTHMLTGYVEVNIKPDHSMEHPMWCLMGEGYFPHYFYSEVVQVFFKYAPQICMFVGEHADEDDSKAASQEASVVRHQHIMVEKQDTKSQLTAHKKPEDLEAATTTSMPLRRMSDQLYDLGQFMFRRLKESMPRETKKEKQEAAEKKR